MTTDPGRTRTARVIAASNRAAAGVYADTTGPLLVDWLRDHGFSVGDAEVVPDGDPVAQALHRAVADGVDCVLTTGGTGINPNDRTPEATAPLLEREIPGLADAVRTAGLPEVPAAVLSRGLAGIAGRTLMVNLPGSRGGVRDGLRVLEGVLDHALDQLGGGDHQHSAGEAEHSHKAAPNPEPEPSTGPEHSHEPEPEHSHEPEPNPDAGGHVARARVIDEPLDVAEHAALVEEAAAGAVVTFSGVVRDHDGGRGVQELEYVGHPSAAEVIVQVAADLSARHEGVRGLAVSHRVGTLAIGDVALACAVAGEHRREAFAACSDLVDEVKRRLPIWKHQVFTDGDDEWVNCP